MDHFHICNYTAINYPQGIKNKIEPDFAEHVVVNVVRLTYNVNGYSQLLI